MRNGFRQSMAWLHTWSGLVVGWVLFAVFVTGTASYYRTDISAWMRPELKQGQSFSADDMARAAELGAAHLQTQAATVRSWFIGLPQPDNASIDLFWRTRPGTPPGQARLEPTTGAPLNVRETRGGDFLYRFHFELHMQPIWGRWVVGVCAMIMLVALISGVITHRRIFADFFTFRRAKAPQRAWLDAHNVTGVLALPFHLMITYTGLATLMLMYMPWGVTSAYKGDQQQFFVESNQITAPRAPSGQAGNLAPLGPMVKQAMALFPERLERLSIINPRDTNATVVAVFEESRGLAHEHPQIAFDGITGAVLEVRQGGVKPAARTFTTMVGLHEAHFAGMALRILFFVCGLMGCAMVATGLLLWSVARLPKRGERPFLGLRLVQALNVGTVAGLPAAIAAYFLTNRLLPFDIMGRSDWEIRVFFAVWIAIGTVSFFRPHRSAWREMLSVVALLFASTAVVDILTVDRHPIRNLSFQDGTFIWFDVALLLFGGLAAYAARKVFVYRSLRRDKTARPRLKEAASYNFTS